MEKWTEGQVFSSCCVREFTQYISHLTSTPKGLCTVADIPHLSVPQPPFLGNLRPQQVNGLAQHLTATRC